MFLTKSKAPANTIDAGAKTLTRFTVVREFL